MPVYPYARMPVCRYARVPVYPCTRVPVYPCTRVGAAEGCDLLILLFKIKIAAFGSSYAGSVNQANTSHIRSAEQSTWNGPKKSPARLAGGFPAISPKDFAV